MANITSFDAEYEYTVTLGLIFLSSIGVQEEYQFQRPNLNTPVSREPLTPLEHLSALLLGSSAPDESDHVAAVSGVVREEGVFALIVSQTTLAGKAGEDIQKLALRPIERNTKESAQEILKSWSTRSYVSDLVTILTDPNLTSKDRPDAERYVLRYASERMYHHVRASRMAWKSGDPLGPSAIILDYFNNVKNSRLWDSDQNDWRFKLTAAQVDCIRAFNGDLVEGNQLLVTKGNLDILLEFIVEFEDFVLTKMLFRNISSKDMNFDDQDLVYTLSYAKRCTSRGFGTAEMYGDDLTSHDGATKAGMPEDDELGAVLDSTGAQSDQVIRYHASLFV
ncbi:hypothetical protein PM082_004684 [Marasmius tenuissimus]|nr:hypothetical protein PM082_004684 [Marasmius tenuissimus]